MGLPVKISDALVAEAREEAEATHRSLTAQIEHWAKLGQSVEKVLLHDEVRALKKPDVDVSGVFPDPARRERVTALFRQLIDGIDRQQLSQKLKAGRTVYQPGPGGSGSLERIEPDGRRTLGRMENRRFIPDAAPKRSRG